MINFIVRVASGGKEKPFQYQLTVVAARITMKNPSSAPAVPITQGRRINMSMPKIFWMQGRKTPIIVPILPACFCYDETRRQLIIDWLIDWMNIWKINLFSKQLSKYHWKIIGPKTRLIEQPAMKFCPLLNFNMILEQPIFHFGT